MRRAVVPLALAALSLPGLLGPAAPAAAQDIAFRTWGLRAGVGDSPDQFIAGAELNLGEFIPHLRFQPNFEVGVGDDTTILSVTAPVHYRFPIEEGFTLYAGGGVTVAAIDRDDPPLGQDDSEFDIAPVAVGGVEWAVGAGDVFVELGASGGDVHDLKLLLGWLF